MPTETTETYVLYEPFSSGRQGKRFCFAEVTGIGPRMSADPKEWARFDSRDAALRSPAALHAMTFYEPRLLSEIEEDTRAK